MLCFVWFDLVWFGLAGPRQEHGGETDRARWGFQVDKIAIEWQGILLPRSRFRPDLIERREKDIEWKEDGHRAGTEQTASSRNQIRRNRVGWSWTGGMYGMEWTLCKNVQIRYCSVRGRKLHEPYMTLCYIY